MVQFPSFLRKWPPSSELRDAYSIVSPAAASSPTPPFQQEENVGKGMRPLWSHSHPRTCLLPTCSPTTVMLLALGSGRGSLWYQSVRGDKGGGPNSASLNQAACEPLCESWGALNPNAVVVLSQGLAEGIARWGRQARTLGHLQGQQQG